MLSVSYLDIFNGSPPAVLEKQRRGGFFIFFSSVHGVAVNRDGFYIGSEFITGIWIKKACLPLRRAGFDT